MTTAIDRVRPSRPRPRWLHVAFCSVLILLLLAVAFSAGADDAGTGDDVAVAVGFAGATVLAVLVSVFVDPYAGPLLLAATTVVDAAVIPSDIDDNTFAFAVPVTVCAAFYYGLHVWVTSRVWQLSDCGRRRVHDDVRERRGLVLEIGRRFLVAWALLYGLTVLGAMSHAFGDHAESVTGAVRDAGGVVVVIDVLAVAPTRFLEARRVFDEHRRRPGPRPDATVAPLAALAGAPDVDGARARHVDDHA